MPRLAWCRMSWSDRHRQPDRDKALCILAEAADLVGAIMLAHPLEQDSVYSEMSLADPASFSSAY
jgi:hypothetical protein